MSGRVVYVVALLLLAAGLYTCWCGTPLLWDGAYQLTWSLVEQTPYKYQTRFHSWVIWWPVVWLSRFTENQSALTMAYGMPFLLAPVAGLLVSWWFVKNTSPRLIIWPIFGICAGSLPGQIFIINDSLFQIHLFWPVFLGAMVPLSRWQWVAWSVCAVFQFSHQIGAPMMGGTALGVLVLALLGRDGRQRYLINFAILFALALLATWKIYRFYDSYADQEFSLATAGSRWKRGVVGWPLGGLVFMWAAGALVYVRSWVTSEAARRRISFAAGLCVVVACGMWVHWASDAHLWAGALDYRRWVVPLCFPFFALAYLERVREVWGRKQEVISEAGVEDMRWAWVDRDAPARQRSDEKAPLRPLVGTGADPTGRGLMALLLAGTFVAVLGVQSAVFAVWLQRLQIQVRDHQGPAISSDELRWVDYSPLEHWGLLAQVIYIQGKTPNRLIVDWMDWQVLDRGKVPIARFEVRPQVYEFTEVNAAPKHSAGYYDFQPVLKELREGR